MPSFGLPSMDDSVNDHSKIEKAMDAKDELSIATKENGELAQTIDQSTPVASNGEVSPLANGNNDVPVEAADDQGSPLPNGTGDDQIVDDCQDSPSTNGSGMVPEIADHDQDSPLTNGNGEVPEETIDDTHESALTHGNGEVPETVDHDQGLSSDGNIEMPEISDAEVSPLTNGNGEVPETVDDGQDLPSTNENGEVPEISDTEISFSIKENEEPLQTIEENQESHSHLANGADAAPETEPDASASSDVVIPASTESTSDHQSEEQSAAVQSTGIEPVPLLLDDTGSLVEEYGSPMAVDEQDGPNTFQSIQDQPPLPQPHLFEATTPANLVQDAPSESPAVTNELDSFLSAKSNLLMEFNSSVEAMEIDSVGDATATIIEAQSDTSGVGSAFSEVPDEAVISQSNMSAEETEAVIVPVAAPPPVLGDLPVEEKPLASKGSYAIDWDNFDENAVPNPFGGRASSGGKAKAPIKRPVKKQQPKTEENPKEEPTEQGGGSTPAPAPPVADDNANVVKPAESSANVQKDQVAAKKADEDVKNSNVVPEESINPVSQSTPPKKENVSASNAINKAPAPRPSPQQTAVVAPTVHVAAVTGSGNEVDNASAASRNALRRPPIKTSASVNATVQQTVPMPAQNNRHSPPKGARSGDESISEEEMFVMASSDPFNDSAAFEYLQQAGGASRGSADSNLHRQSLYQNFDPLVGGDSNVASGSETKQRRQQQQQPTGPGITDEVLSVSDITFSEKDELLLINTPSPVRDQTRAEEPPTAPSTVVKKKQGPKVSSGANDSLAHGDSADAERLLSITPNQNTSSPAASGSGQEIKLQFQALLLAKEKEFLMRMEEEKCKRMQLDMELTAVKKEAEAAKQNSAEMSFVVAEYEKTVRQLIAEKDKPKQNRLSGEFEIIKKERDQALDDLQTVENAFSELNRRYETLRNSSAEFKKNEEALKTSLAEYQHKLKKSEEKFNKLYAHAEHKLELANQEIERLQKAKETDTLALRATLKKRDLQVETLEKNLEQKHKEILELTAICDELIQKAGGH